jgi:hypothetical protein
MKFRPEQWPWSSYRAHAGLDHAPEFLAMGEFQRLLGTTPAEAATVYRRLVQSGLDPVSDAGVEPALAEPEPGDWFEL